MRIYTPSQLKGINVNQHEGKIKEIQRLLLELILAIEEHIDEFSSQLGQERIAALISEVPALEKKIHSLRE